MFEKWAKPFFIHRLKLIITPSIYEPRPWMLLVAFKSLKNVQVVQLFPVSIWTDIPRISQDIPDIPRISHLPCGNIASEYMLHYRRCCLTSTKQSCMSPMVLVNRYWSFLQRLYSFSVAPAALWSCISQYIGFIGRTQGKRQYNNNQYCMYNFISLAIIPIWILWCIVRSMCKFSTTAVLLHTNRWASFAFHLTALHYCCT